MAENQEQREQEDKGEVGMVDMHWDLLMAWSPWGHREVCLFSLGCREQVGSVRWALRGVWALAQAAAPSGHTGAGMTPTGHVEGADTPWALGGGWGRVLPARAVLWWGRARAEAERVVVR